MAKPDSDQFYSKEETQRRFEAALRGARVAGPQHREGKPGKPKGKPSNKRAAPRAKRVRDA